MNELQPHQRIFVPIDQNEFGDDDQRKIDRYADRVGGLKIGITAYHSKQRLDPRISIGSSIESFMLNYHPHLQRFVDGKFKDIPDQIAGAARGVAASGAWGFTIHTSNSVKALRAAVDNAGSSLVIGVTVLTSMTDVDSVENYGHIAERAVPAFARKFAAAGGRAIVCSPKELRFLGGVALTKITPAIRNADAPPDDQNRTATAFEAARDGADYFVIGRPITGAADPADAAARFAEDIARGLAYRGQ